MRRCWFVIVVYVIVHSDQGDYPATYDGIPQSTITSLLSDMGRTGDVVTQKQYQNFVDAHPYVKSVDPVKDQAKVDLNTKTKTDSQRIDAIIKYLDLDKP